MVFGNSDCIIYLLMSVGNVNFNALWHVITNYQTGPLFSYLQHMLCDTIRGFCFFCIFRTSVFNFWHL